MKTLIKGACIVNEDELAVSDLLINGEFIELIEPEIEITDGVHVIDAKGLHLFPGLIDDQVHFREPGLTHKGEIYTEAKAAVAGGITSYMEMPNTVPNATRADLLEEKYKRASEVSLANYSFYMGTTNHNLEEIEKIDFKKVCGLKIFMGSSTGDMLVDSRETLDAIFSKVKAIIALHCEFDPLVKENQKKIIDEYGEDLPAYFHPIIRNSEVCYRSSSLAIELAKKHNTRIHILHISTAAETKLFSNQSDLKNKHITSEACIHHLWFSDEDYNKLGNRIKWNPAVKTMHDREEIFNALLDDRIDVIATDHAPHTLEEKNKKYLEAPSGGPLVQHALLALIDLCKSKNVDLRFIPKKTAHNVAELFEIKNRGYIREGYYADFVLVNLNKTTEVKKENILYKCGWSPFEGHTFSSSIESTFVNGNKVYYKGKFDESKKGLRLEFNR